MHERIAKKMKFQCETAELKKATKTVIAAVAAKPSTPISAPST